MPTSLSYDTIVHSVCPHDCADTCSILSYVKDGRLVKIQGNPHHPVTRGFLCRKFSLAPERVYDPDRILFPLARTGPKGSGRFQRISWPEAVGLISTRWKEILAESGPYSILPFYGSGTEGLINGRIAGKRFFNRLGSLQLERTICTKAGRLGFRYTMGTSMGADPAAVGKTKLVIAWGVNAPSTHVHFYSFLTKARSHGTLYAIVNPLAIKDSENADFLLRPLPGTDAALALGMMHVIIQEKRYDADFAACSTIGFDALKERVKDYPPEKVEAITGIKTEAIQNFARLYADSRPSFIFIGPGCQRHSNGGMTVRTLSCLPALTGDWKFPGGGVYYPTSTVFPVDWSPLEGEELRPNPPAAYNMIHLGRLLTQANPPVKSLYVFNGNPASTLYHQRELRAALMREDLFTIVHEIFMTDTARYADLILPAATSFEYLDLLYSYFYIGVLLNQPAIEPLGECKSNLETFQLLAQAMGFEDSCFRKDSWSLIQEILNLEDPLIKGVILDRLQKDGFALLRPKKPWAPFADGKFPTPSGKIELFCSQMAEQGHDPHPAYIPLQEGPESTPELFMRYPLYFLTPSGHPFLNTNFGKDGGRINEEDEPTLIIHPEDARPRGIQEGMLVDVFNDRGHCVFPVTLSDETRRGVVTVMGQWWDQYYERGMNPNQTTPDFPADMGGGSAFNTNLVEVRPC